MAEKLFTSISALGMVLAPALMKFADAPGEVAIDGEEINPELLCISKAKAPVHERYGGRNDIVARLSKEQEVQLLSRRKKWRRIAYASEGKLGTGWLTTSYLGECAESPEDNHADEPPRPTPSSSGKRLNLYPFGKPEGAIPGGQLLENTAYDCYHDPDLKFCRWVAYCFEPRETGRLKRFSGDFFADDRLPAGSRAEPLDYKGLYERDLSGFDRGHLAPDAALKGFGLDAQKETYRLSNITPQYSRLNQGFWRELEDHIRDWALPKAPVCVTTGTLFEPGKPLRRVGRNKVAVPDAYYSVIVQHEAPDVIAFVAPNAPEKLTWAEAGRFLRSVDEVEERAALDFLSALPDQIEEPVEAAVPEEPWE